MELVEGDDPRQSLGSQLEKTIALFSSLDDEYASKFVYEPGKWTIKQCIGHLSDTERVFSYRALRLARRDKTPLPGFEQDDYVVEGGANERKLAKLIAELRAVRQATLALFADLPPEAWLRRGRVNEWELSVRGILFTLAGHELHHDRIFRDRYGLGGERRVPN